MRLFPVFYKKNSGEIARNRLKVILLADKISCSPEMIEMIRLDLIRVISKYIEIEPEKIEIQMKKPSALYAYIPFHNTSYKGTF